MNIIKPMKTIASTSTLCLIVAFSSLASANPSDYDIDSPRYHQMSGGHSEHMMKRMIKKLSLSEQQQVQIKAIKTQAREQHEALRDSMKEFKGEERMLLQAQSFDEQAYTALRSTYQPVFTEMALTRAKTKHAIFNVLTTEQQEKWLRIMENRKERHNRKRG